LLTHIKVRAPVRKSPRKSVLGETNRFKSPRLTVDGSLVVVYTNPKLE
jgi:hypothetical protein